MGMSHVGMKGDTYSSTPRKWPHITCLKISENLKYTSVTKLYKVMLAIINTIM